MNPEKNREVFKTKNSVVLILTKQVILSILLSSIFTPKSFSQGIGTANYWLKKGDDLFMAQDFDEAYECYRQAKNMGAKGADDKIDNARKAKIEKLTKAINRATALYWASESDKLNPIQGLRLLEKATAKANDSISINYTKEQTQNIFNNSNTHQFQEKRRFYDSSTYSDYTISPNNKFLIKKNTKGELEIQELISGKSLTFLKKEKITYAKFSPDDKWVITNDSTGESKVWEIAVSKKPGFLKNEIHIRSAEFSNDSKWLVTKTFNDSTKVWEINSRKPAEFLENQNSMYYAIFSSDSNWLIVNYNDASTKIYSLRDRIIPEYLKDSNIIYSASFSQDSKWLITYHIKTNPKVRNLSTGNIPYFVKKDANIKVLKFSEDGKGLIVIDSLGVGKLWDLNKEFFFDFLGEIGEVWNVQLSENSKLILITKKNGEKQIWDVKKKKYPHFLINEGRLKTINFSNNGKWLITINMSNHLIVWETTTNTKVIEEKNVQHHFLSENNRWIEVKKWNGILKIWDIEKNAAPQFLDGEELYRDIFSPDGRYLITKTLKNNGEYRIWEINNEKNYIYLLNDKKIEGFTFSPNYQYLILKDIEDKNTVFNTEKGLLLNDSITNAYFSPNSKWLVYTNSKNATTRLSYIDKETIIDSCEIGMNLIGVHFSSNAKYLITLNEKSEYQLLDLKTCSLPNFLVNESFNENTKFFFSLDSKWLFIYYGNFESKIWDVENATPYYLPKYKKRVFRTKFSKDNKWIVTIFNDNDYIIRKMSSSDELLYLPNENEIYDLEFSTDSRWLITNKYSGVYKVWNIHNDNITQLLKSEGDLRFAKFSLDSKWLLTSKGKQYKIFELATCKNHDFLKDIKEKYHAQFSLDSKWLITTSRHKIITWDLKTGVPIQTLWVNKTPENAQIIEGRYLFVRVGKAILKTDLETQKGDIFSYGDGESLDYTYDEIKEWIDTFGDKYLLPLDDEIKKKYNVK